MNQVQQHNAGTADESAWNEFCGHIDELMATGKYGGRNDAGLAVRKLYPHLANVTPQGVKPSGSGRPVSSGMGAAGYIDVEVELDRRARAIVSRDGISYAQAYVKALNDDPRIYEAYLKQALARLEREKRGQQSA